MLAVFSNKIFRVFKPRYLLDGGTAAKTKSGDPRWTYNVSLSEANRNQFEALCRQLMYSEPDFQFEPCACESRKLPENAQQTLSSGHVWLERLSPSAERFLVELDHLYESRPIVAIKIAVIIASSFPGAYVLQKEALRRFFEWLKQDGPDCHDRIKLGIQIRQAWDWTFDRKAKDGLADVLVETLTREAEHKPDFVSHLYSASKMAVEGLFTYNANPSTSLAIGRSLRRVNPEFAKRLYGQYLLACRSKFQGSQATEAQMRSVVEELFEFESASPYPDARNSGFAYSSLGRYGYPDTAWYPIALDRLYDAACTVEDQKLAAAWFGQVAINAAPQTLLRSQAMEGFCKYLSSYRDLPLDNRHEVQSFVKKMLLDTMKSACDEDSRWAGLRSYSLPPDPQHPIVDVCTKTYWEMVDWLYHTPSALSLMVLVEAAEHSEPSMADAAGMRMVQIFREMAELNPEEAGESLAELARTDWYSDVREYVRKSRQARCVELFHKLHPMLNYISPEAGKHAMEGFRPPH